MDGEKLENFLDKFNLDEENFAVFNFFWGTAVKNTATDEWLAAFLAPGSEEVNLEGISVMIHENGIEFSRKEEL